MDVDPIMNILLKKREFITFYVFADAKDWQWTVIFKKTMIFGFDSEFKPEFKLAIV